MLLTSVNIGKVTPIQHAKPSGLTGIYKQPVAEPVQVTPLGLVNDAIVDTENHGGVDQAVYVYGEADYAWWSAELSRPLAPGTFGENLTLAGMESADFLVGDRLVFSGEVVLEVTCPRVPCVTLAARMGDPRFVKRFRYAERPGLYCRVIQPGLIRVGETVLVEKYPGVQLPVVEMFREFYNPRPSVDYLRRYLTVPSPVKDREVVEERLRLLQK